MSCIKWSNWSRSSDCAPSQRAFAGLLCTSTMMPSAPTASAAFARGGTSDLIPTAWLGSTSIGRCVFSFNSATAPRSSVFLVAVSKVLMPLSQSITFSFPDAIIYSALIRNSSIVLQSPLFRSIGFFNLPTSFNRSKFCIFLAPICMISTFSKRGICV